MQMHKGWFKIDGVQDGDRTVEEQLQGLETIADRFRNASVLDLGCAEGLIGKHCVTEWGARKVDGVGCVATELDEARRQCADLPMRFFEGDMREEDDLARLFEALDESYDVVLLLSIIHKMRDQFRFLRWALGFARDLVVVRLPGPVIEPRRIGDAPSHVHKWLSKRYDVIAEPATCVEPNTQRAEWMCVYAVR